MMFFTERVAIIFLLCTYYVHNALCKENIQRVGLLPPFCMLLLPPCNHFAGVFFDTPAKNAKRGSQSGFGAVYFVVRYALVAFYRLKPVKNVRFSSSDDEKLTEMVSRHRILWYLKEFNFKSIYKKEFVH